MKKLTALIPFIFPILLSAQSVAINTDASLPHGSAILDIKSDSKGILTPRLTTLQRTSLPGPAIGLTVFDMDTYSYWMYRGDINGGWAELQHNYQNYWNASGFNIYTKYNGNVGIGTNTPTEKLSINATDPTINFLTGGTERGFIQANGNDMKLGTHIDNVTGSIVLTTRTTERFRITPEGKFGIGTSAPVGKVQIVQGFNASLSSHGYLMLGTELGTNMVFDTHEIMARNNGNAANLTLQNGSGNVYIGDPTNFNSFHRLGVDGNAVITGNVRIGSTVTPSGYKLAVDGKAICTELMVRLVPNWPDYVFSKDYKLPGLNEVEDFINKNNHLPGIPSAKTLESSGLNIGEMQKLQMEKIEELTLYIIQLKKEIEKLSAHGALRAGSGPQDSVSGKAQQ